MNPGAGDAPETERADPAWLRRRAAETLDLHADGLGPLLTGDQALELVHELRVNQDELKQQNEELRRSRREAEVLRDRYADLYDFAPAGYFTLDAEGVIREANLTGSVLLSTDRQSLIGTRFAAFLDPACIPLFTAFCDLLRSTDTTETCDLLLSGSAGRNPWYAQAKGRGEPSQEGAGTWIRLMVSDITARRQAEEALLEYAENLRRSNEDLERFAYVASHDLQEPLRSIVSFSQLLDRRYRSRLDQDADEFIGFIVEGGNRMQSLILDLLAYSRVNTTKQGITRTDVTDLLAGVERSLGVQIREAGAALTHDPMPVVMADPLQVEQVFSNLVSNALKFRRPDEPLRVHVGARRADGLWEFSVADNGIGIAPEYFDRIFVIFQRLHTKDRYGGNGIGLAIVKRIVDRHGGRVWVESAPGEGSTFVFTLPAA